MDQTEIYESDFITSKSPKIYCKDEEFTSFYEKKSDTVEESKCTDTELECISVTIPYNSNDNFDISRGSLVFVDFEGNVRPLYRTPQDMSINKIPFSRIISTSASLGKFNVVRSSIEVLTSSTVLDRVDSDINPSWLSSDTTSNYAIDSRLNVSYIVGNGEIYGIRANGVRFMSRKLPPTNKLNVQVVAVGNNESVYTASVVSGIEDITIPDVIGRPIPSVNLPREFHNLGLLNGIGYIVHMHNANMNLSLVKAKELVFRGMYFHNDKLVVTGSYCGQLTVSTKKIAKEMPGTTSFILAFDTTLQLLWYRLITCDNVSYNIIGDVTINKLGQIFTTCRFKGNLALSDLNSIEVVKHISSDDEAVVLIGLQGEFQSCRVNTVMAWWRMLPITLPQSQVSNYISLTNNGYDIFMSAYTSNSLSKTYNVGDHYFVAAFTPELVDLFYHPINSSTNKYNSRIIAYNGERLFTGSTTWNNLFIHPFGLISEILEQTGYYLTISLKGPRLIGMVIDKTYDKVHVQFKGYTSIYKDAKVGRDYYVDLPSTTENKAMLTPNPHNSLETLRYYGTAVKNGVILIA